MATTCAPRARGVPRITVCGGFCFHPSAARPAEVVGFKLSRPSRLQRIFLGRGTPAEIAFALGLLAQAGRIQAFAPGVSLQVALQSYCDTYIGVDCSGFANGYFSAIGLRDEPADTPNDRPGISDHARWGRRLREIPGRVLDHTFCWVKNESVTERSAPATIDFRHILVIDWV